MSTIIALDVPEIRFGNIQRHILLASVGQLFHARAMDRVPPDFWSRSRVIHPLMARLLARQGGRILQVEEIAEEAGLPPAQVWTLMQQTDWRGVDIPTAEAYLKACDCDFTQRETWHRHWSYATQNPRWAHVTRAPNFQTELQPLLNKLVQQ